MAAESAVEEGARVLLLAKGLGSLPLTTGCIDVLGYFPATSKTPLTAPASEIKRVPAQHPYGKVGAEGLWQALAHFQKILESENYPYKGSGEKNILIPTSLGSLHPTGLVPETLRQGDLSAPGSALLLGFEGLKDFFPLFAAENLNLLQQKGSHRLGFQGGPSEKAGSGRKSPERVKSCLGFRKRRFSRLHCRGNALSLASRRKAWAAGGFRNSFAEKSLVGFAGKGRGADIRDPPSSSFGSRAQASEYPEIKFPKKGGPPFYRVFEAWRRSSRNPELSA